MGDPTADHIHHVVDSMPFEDAAEICAFLWHKQAHPEALVGCCRLLEACLDDPTNFNVLQWNVQRWLFAGRLEAGQAETIRFEHMAPVYLKHLASLDAHGLLSQGSPGKRSGERVLYVSHQILGPQHAPTKVCLDYSAALALRGMEVLILNTNLLPSTNPLQLANPLLANVHPQLNGRDRIDHHGVALMCQTAVPGGMSHAKLNQLARLAVEFDPTVVVSHGEFNLFGDWFAARWPTVCLPSAVGQPVTCAHAVGDYFGQLQPLRMAPLLAHDPVVRGLANFTPIAQASAKRTRRQLGWPEDRYLFAVVGTRLHMDVGPRFQKMLGDLLDGAANTSVVFIGTERPALEEAWLRQHRQRIYFFPSDPDLPSLLQCADAYLNPPRAGGGVTALMALHEKLPVLTLDEGDAAAVVGADLVCSDERQFTRFAIEMAADPAVHRAFVAKGDQALAAQPSFEDVMDGVVDLIEAAQSVARPSTRRLGA